GMRFGLLAMSSSQDVRYNREKLKQGNELANKLWNASRLVLLRVEDVEPAPRPETVEDRWILSRLERITEEATKGYESFLLSRVALELYGAFWGEVCDWYLELVKPRLYDESADRAALSATLLHVLDRVLRLLHPIMPFVTEEIWSFLPGDRGMLISAAWPAPRTDLVDDGAEQVIGRAIEAVTALRRYRDEVGVPAARTLPVRLSADGYEDTAEQIARLARVELVAGDVDGDAVATVAIPGGAVHVLPSDAVDPEEAARRKDERRKVLEQEVSRAEGKLANKGFVEKAPPAVVEAEREKLARFKAELEGLSE
ncbi:MAG: class I tRNA ligase family protein, partial [Thermoleophilaceae bacterium]